MFLRRVTVVAALVAQPLAAFKQLTIRHHVSARQSNHGAGGAGILTKIKELSTQGNTVCVTLNENVESQGLSYTMGMVNAVMDFALQHKDLTKFLMPEIRPPALASADSFRFMFGEPALLSETKWPEMYIATCPFQTNFSGGVGTSASCSVEETRLHANTVFVQSRYETDCNAYVLVSSGITPVYDYSRTWTLLSEKYWHRQSSLGNPSSSELQFPITTAVHLSETVSGESFKKITAALTSLIDPKCLKVELYSDVEKDDADVQLVKLSWENQGVDGIKLFDISTDAATKFDGLAHADILIGGTSGFSRLAAVLGRAHVKLFVQNNGNSYPLDCVQGVSFVPFSGFDKDAVISGLSGNSNVTKVAERCNAWLGK